MRPDTQLAAALLCVGAACSHAGSLDYCQGVTEPSAATQDRLFQVAAIAKQALQDSGHRLALIARSGLSLQRFGHRYSHAGISLQDSPNTPWSVRQLYYACDAQKPRIFDQGISGFVLGVHDPDEGYVSIVLLPPEASAPLQQAALNEGQALQLLGADYSANAYAFSTRYQNCNQWLAELLATAWGALASPGEDAPPALSPRARAQAWLQDAGYQPSALQLWRPMLWLAGLLPWLHQDDHPVADLQAAQFRISMPQSIESFARARWPQAQRLELCYTQKHVVLRRGWEPIGDGCTPAEGDEVHALQSGPI